METHLQCNIMLRDNILRCKMMCPMQYTLFNVTANNSVDFLNKKQLTSEHTQ